MKKIVSLVMVAALFCSLETACAQTDKSKRPSPPASATATLSSGSLITINYSQPSLKGRTIGKDIEPKEGVIWRTGANEATVFETSKDILVNGKALPAGKYGFFSINKGKEWTLIFNKKWDQWGAMSYQISDDALRITATAIEINKPVEKLTYAIDNNGNITLTWGTLQVPFSVK
ncbi:MAG: DUF2911 domain-containing protein [Sphingobacteriia bacterium]|nr:MAG: DUF2911 domain-containing protein [Sphingobacteriia bacterium]TAH09275.1 MAG: DUF2911 domain-containing protein [Sphingobacteriia bacterium]